MAKDKGLRDPYDFSDRYNTKLSDDEEKEFQKSDMARDVYDYDSRGAWKEMKAGTMKADERGHLGDKYKKPNHPTFSNESIYHGKDGHEGGSWGKNAKGQTTYRVGKGNMHSKDELRGYFAQREPDVELIDEREEK